MSIVRKFSTYFVDTSWLSTQQTLVDYSNHSTSLRYSAYWSNLGCPSCTIRIECWRLTWRSFSDRRSQRRFRAVLVVPTLGLLPPLLRPAAEASRVRRRSVYRQVRRVAQFRSAVLSRDLPPNSNRATHSSPPLCILASFSSFSLWIRTPCLDQPFKYTQR